MQMSRLFEIVYVLLERKNVTAKELSEKFEVSTRTIYRDVDTLSAAGIPIYANKGKGGGIRLMDHFILNKALLDTHEQLEILSALQSLKAVNPNQTNLTLSKLSTLFHQKDYDWIEADFSDWRNNPKRQANFECLKKAILNRSILTFVYNSSYGKESSRRVYPLKLWFKHKNWYLKAFCTDKNALRTFKLNRMVDLQPLESSFTLPETADLSPIENPSASSFPTTELKIKFHPSQIYRLMDEFDPEQIEKCDDGDYLVTVEFPEDEWVYGFLLSFGPFANLLSPPHIRQILKKRLKETLQLYE